MTVPCYRDGACGSCNNKDCPVNEPDPIDNDTEVGYDGLNDPNEREEWE